MLHQERRKNLKAAFQGHHLSLPSLAYNGVLTPTKTGTPPAIHFFYPLPQSWDFLPPSPPPNFCIQSTGQHNYQQMEKHK